MYRTDDYLQEEELRREALEDEAFQGATCQDCEHCYSIENSDDYPVPPSLAVCEPDGNYWLTEGTASKPHHCEAFEWRR